MYITERLTVNNVTGISVAGTTTEFDTDLGAVTGTYNGREIEFTSGPCKGQQATILTYVQTGIPAAPIGEITLKPADALSRTPGADTFIIWTETGINGALDFDLPVRSRFCKIVYIGIVQLTHGKMDMNFEIWESTAARGLPFARTNFYQKILNRQIEMTPAQGGEYGESLSGDPMPYFDRDDIETDLGGGRRRQLEGPYYLHCRIENDATEGTLSDFAVTIKIADMGENA